MVTLQEYLNKKYPTKKEKEKVERIDVRGLYQQLDGKELDCRSYPNLKVLFLYTHYLKSPIIKIDLKQNINLVELSSYESQLTNIDLSNNPNLKILNLRNNQLTSTGFLNYLPNPEKLEELALCGNNIQPTNIEIFSKFINLKLFQIGNGKESSKKNKFYGSLESLKNLTKLEIVDIKGININKGLEYLSDVRIWSDYDIKSWQLAHPHKMYKARPELFYNPKTKSKWVTALRDKTNKTQEKLQETKKTEPLATKKIKRLETKLDNLKLIQENISKNSLIKNLTEKEKQNKINKETQTVLVGQQIEEMEAVVEQLRQIQLPPK